MDGWMECSIQNIVTRFHHHETKKKREKDLDLKEIYEEKRKNVFFFYLEEQDKMR